MTTRQLSLFMSSLLFILLNSNSSATNAGVVTRVLLFHSDIQVHQDGQLDVTEEITVHCGGVIPHGFTRRFPGSVVKFHGYGKGHYTHTAHYLSSLPRVTCDGTDIPYDEEQTAGDDDIKDTLVPLTDRSGSLSPGTHQFTINYTWSEPAHSFLDHWSKRYSVTGNGWEIPIEKTTLTLTPPGSSTQTRVSAWLQSYINKEAVPVRLDDSGRFTVDLTNAPEPGSELLFELTYIHGPSLLSLNHHPATRWVLAHLPPFSVVAVLLMVWGYYTRGQGRRRTATAILHEPPAQMSPMTLHFFRAQDVDCRTVLAGLANLGVQGYLHFAQCTEGVMLTVNPNHPQSPNAPEERRLLIALKKRDHTELIAPSDGQRLHIVSGGMIDQLVCRYIPRLICDNAWRNRGDIAITLLGLLIVACAAQLVDSRDLIPPLQTFSVGPLDAWGWYIGGTFFTALGYLFMFYNAMPDIIAGNNLDENGRQPGWTLCVVGGLTLLFGTMALLEQSVSYLICLLALLEMKRRYHHTRNYTREGRQLMAEIQAFRRYLLQLTQGWQRQPDMPELSFDLFERYLPYAFALDMERQWARVFTNRLGAYTPTWFRMLDGNALLPTEMVEILRSLTPGTIID